MSGQALALDQAAAGMVLADDLRDAGGALLLPAGAVLSEAVLAGLRRRGVAGCRVETAHPAEAAHPANAAEPAAEAEHAAPGSPRQERAQARLRHLFRHSAGAGGAATLLRLLSDYRARG